MGVYLKHRGGPSQEQTCLKSVVSDIRRYLFTLQFISKALARVGFLFSFSRSLLKKCPHLPEVFLVIYIQVIFCSFYCFEKFIYLGSSLASMASMHSIYVYEDSKLFYKSVRFRMNLWGHRFSKNANQKF